MKVLKFGGTSVGTVDSILSVKKIVEAVEEPVIVVVSALGGITDKLLHTAAMAAKGDVGYEKEYSEIVTRHLDVIQGVIPDKDLRIDVQKQVMSLLDELGNIYKGVYLINDLSAKTSDTIVGYVAYFRTVGGFEKYFYMTKEDVEAHGRKYSKTYSNGVWSSDFNAMALKTVLKLLLSKYGILSVEMQRAITMDQAEVRGEINTVEDIDAVEVAYVDNDQPSAKDKLADIASKNLA